jgi:hypothetical protein
MTKNGGDQRPVARVACASWRVKDVKRGRTIVAGGLAVAETGEARCRRFGLWRDTDSNRGHYDFQVSGPGLKTGRFAGDSPVRHPRPTVGFLGIPVGAGREAGIPGPNRRCSRCWHCRDCSRAPSHGEWAAVRDVDMTLCAEPLHGIHRVGVSAHPRARSCPSRCSPPSASQRRNQPSL